MSMSDAALSQPGISFVCSCGPEEYLKCLDEHVSQVNSDSAPSAVNTKLFVAVQSTVFSGLDNTVVVNNEEASFTSLVGPAKLLGARHHQVV